MCSKRFVMLTVLASVVAVGMVSTAQANLVNLLTNGDFENPVLGLDEYSATIPGWNRSLTGADNTAMGHYESAWPTNFAYAGCSDNTGTDISQTVGQILANTTYTLSVDVIHIDSWVDSPLNVALIAEVTPVLTSYQYVRTLAASHVVGERVTISGTTGPTVTAGNLIAVYFGIDSGAGTGSTYGAGYDNAVLTASTVPEPGTLALLATGLLGLLAYAWRKRR